MSCRTGRLRGGRSLRDAYAGRGKAMGIGPPAGRRKIFILTIWRARPLWVHGTKCMAEGEGFEPP